MKKIMLFFSLFCAATSLSAQENRDWAQYGRYERSNGELRGTYVKAVFIGNSITDNWATADPGFFADNNFVGRGISGQTTLEMLARFRRDVIDLSPEAVVILAGINDIAQNQGFISIENTFGNIVSMCELAMCNDICVVLCSVLPCDRFAWRPEIEPAEKVRALNALLRGYAAAQHLVYVDYHKALDNGKGGLDTRFSEDGCHPTLYGYSLMEPMVVEGVEQAIRGRDGEDTSSGA